MSSIIEMPELVLGKIIEFSDFKSVLTLRQVCRDFRNFIDDLKDSKLPDSKFKAIALLVRNGLETNSIIRLSYEDQNFHSQEHFYSDISNSRSFNGRTPELGSSNIVDVAIRDLELVLKFQKSNLIWLNFHFDNSGIRNDSSIRTLPVKLTTMFGKINRRIKTKSMHIKPFHNSQVIPILQFADPETLKVIRLFPPDEDTEMESDEIVKTQQWKKAEKLVCHFCLMNLNVEDVCQFSIIYLKTNFIATRDLDTLKKTFDSSTKYERWTFVCKNFHEQELSSIWGPALLFDYAFHWNFRTKESEEKVPDIGIWFEPIGVYRITFEIIGRRNVPNGAIVQDYNGN